MEPHRGGYLRRDPRWCFLFCCRRGDARYPDGSDAVYVDISRRRSSRDPNAEWDGGELYAVLACINVSYDFISYSSSNAATRYLEGTAELRDINQGPSLITTNEPDWTRVRTSPMRRILLFLPSWAGTRL